MHVGEQHLHHLAKRLHSANRTIDEFLAKRHIRYAVLVNAAEIGAGAWLGGMIEGKTNNGTLPLVKMPINLGVGVGLSVLGLLDFTGRYGTHLANVGAGFLGSYAATMGYAFGKKWADTGSFPLFHKKAKGGAAPMPSPDALAAAAALHQAAQAQAAGG